MFALPKSSTRKLSRARQSHMPTFDNGSNQKRTGYDTFWSLKKGNQLQSLAKLVLITSWGFNLCDGQGTL